MQGYAFNHIETWSRKGGANSKRKNGQRAWTADEIIDELAREIGSCPHVPAPNKNPLILAGSCANFDELREAHEEACNAIRLIDYTNPKTRKKCQRKKKVRQDTHTLFTAISSLPIKSAEATTDPNLMRQCHEAMLHAAKHEAKRLADCGGEFALAVLHTDEEYVHIHVVGLDRERGSVNELHPGKAAIDELRRGQGWGPINMRHGNRLYCKAMRRWQDDKHREVFSKFGLCRYGPKRARMTRDQWKRQKVAQEEAISIQGKIDKFVSTVRKHAEYEKHLLEYYELKDEEIQERWKEIEEAEEAINLQNSKNNEERIQLQAERNKIEELNASYIKREVILKEKESEVRKQQTALEVQSYLYDSLVTGKIEFEQEDNDKVLSLRSGTKLADRSTAEDELEAMLQKDSDTAARTIKRFLDWQSELEIKAKNKADAEVSKLRDRVNASIGALVGFAKGYIVPDSNEQTGYRISDEASVEAAKPYLDRISQHPKAATTICKWIEVAQNRITKKENAANAKLEVINLFKEGFIQIDLDEDENKFIIKNTNNKKLSDQTMKNLSIDPDVTSHAFSWLFDPLKKATIKAKENIYKKEEFLNKALKQVKGIVSLASHYMTPEKHDKFTRRVNTITTSAEITLKQSKTDRGQGTDER
nr:hypothetical protein [uncultured Cohaesibacter sp.]